MLIPSVSNTRKTLIIYIDIRDEQGVQTNEVGLIKSSAVRGAEGSGNQVDWTVSTFIPINSGGVLCPIDWIHLSQTIRTSVNNLDIDSVMVMHPFDSLAYSAAALSFHLSGLPATVIFCDVAHVLFSTDDEYLKTMAQALVANQQQRPWGVYVFSVDEFIPATRCSLMETCDDKRRFVRRTNESTFKVPLFIGHFDNAQFARPTSVAVLPIFPGYNEKHVECSLNCGVNALVLEFTSVRIIDFFTDELFRVLRSAYESQVVVVAITQFYEPGLYDADNCFMDAGVISGADMTREAVYGKLHVLLATELSFEKVRQLVGQNLIGEMT